jgi:hypothetical protein
MGDKSSYSLTALQDTVWCCFHANETEREREKLAQLVKIDIKDKFRDGP